MDVMAAPQAVPSVLDALAWPAETAAWLATCPVGADAISALAAIDPERVGHAARIDLLVAAGRLQAWLASVEQRILATIDARAEEAGDPVDSSGRHWVREEVAAALRLAGLTAEDRLTVAAALAGPLTATGDELARGEITLLQGRAIVEETAVLPDEQRREVEAAVLPCAPRLTVGELRRRLRRAVKKADPCDDEQRHRRAYRDRRVTCRPQSDGMATIWALMPADQAQALMTALTTLAERDAEIPGPEGEERTLDQRRADALGQLAWLALAQPDLPRRHGARPNITVAVSLTTLLGCDQEPGQLTGYGPIPAAMARRIAAEPGSIWRRLIVDPAGRPVDYGRDTYRPPADLREFVINRDRTCVFPGCTRQARDADLDHHVDWAAGGTTDADNVGPLCPRHHQMKHEAGWAVERRPDGYVFWRSPTGHVYVREPEPYPVDDWNSWDPGKTPEPERTHTPAAQPDPPPF